MTDKACQPKVKNGWVYVDGVKIGRYVKTPDGPALEVCDKDRTRSQKRGTRKVVVKLDYFSQLKG